MKKIFYRQFILTTVSRDKLHLAEISAKLEEYSPLYGLQLIGKNILEPIDSTAADFFLIGEYPLEQDLLPEEKIRKNIETIYRELRSYFDEMEVDFCIHVFNPVTRRKRAFFSDMDSTIIANETLDDIAEKAGVGEEVTRITQLGMEGKIDFSESVKVRLSLLKGVDLSPLITEVGENIRTNPGAEILLNTLRSSGVTTFIVTGGFDPLASQVKKRLGFHHLTCNHFGVHEGKCTGEIEGALVTWKEKLSVMENYLLSKGMLKEQTLAVGDGSNDIPLLKAAGLGVAYRGTDKVREEILHQINFTPLTTLLYYQGYSSREFVHD